MSTAEDILSNPGTSWFYLNHRFLYAVGNTKSVDLTEGCQIPRDAQFLLLGCGDIRNILKTVHEINGGVIPRPETLSFHVNDIDDVILARNVVLILIVNTIDPTSTADVKFLWNVWYNLNLSETHCQRLKSLLLDILEKPLEGLEFQTQECSDAIKQVVKYWLVKTVSINDVQSQREKFVCKKSQCNLNSRDEISFAVAVTDLYNFSGFGLDRYDTQKSKQRAEELERYYKTGSTDTVCRGVPNPTLLCPHVDGWRVFPDSLPFSGYNELEFEEMPSLTENCITQLQGQLKSWKEFIKKGGAIKLILWFGDALTLCHRTMPIDQKFDFINSSNLCDCSTPLNVLLACSKRLNRSGVLTVQTMHMMTKGYDSAEKFLETELGIPPSFYPTFLGLRLAEDFQIGTSKFPREFCGLMEVTMRWLSAGSASAVIDLEESTSIVRLFDSLAKSCFESCTLENAKADNTPLTLVYLIKELSSKLKEGAKPLLKRVDNILPKKKTVSGEQFSPVSIEWKVLAMYYFREELHQNCDDALVTMCVPVEIEWGCFPPEMPPPPPAAFIIGYRAVVIEGMENVPLLNQGISTVPWSALSLVDFDYKTGMMRCILPKSQVSTFGPYSVIWPFTVAGRKLPLRPIGPPKRQDSRFPPIPIRRRHENVLPQPQLAVDNVEVIMVVKETELSYRLTLNPVQPDNTLQTIDIVANYRNPRSLSINCTVRSSNREDTHVTEHDVELPCAVVLPQNKHFTSTNTLDLKKAQDAIQGPMLLPLRRIDLKSAPIFPANKVDNLTPFLGQMFTSNDDLMQKMVNTFSAKPLEPLFGLKETLQMIFNFANEPQEDQPKIQAFRLLRGDHQRPSNLLFGYFPHDIFISCRKLHIVNSMPTLDVVWMDLEIYRKQVPQGRGIFSKEAELFLVENGGSVLTPGSWVEAYVSLEEAVLLKKILRLNTLRSVQNLKVYGSPPWCFRSFLQPVYSLLAEQELLEVESQALKLFGSTAVFAESQTTINDQQTTKNIRQTATNEQTTRKPAASAVHPDWPSCTCCGQRKPDMKKCSQCKSVFYCSSACQTKDWGNIHNKICRTLQALQVKDTSSHQKNPRAGNIQAERCGYSECGKVSSDLKTCSRCHKIAYCCKTCQQKDWRNHKHACAAVGKTTAGKNM